MVTKKNQLGYKLLYKIHVVEFCISAWRNVGGGFGKKRRTMGLGSIPDKPKKKKRWEVIVGKEGEEKIILIYIALCIIS